MNKIFKVIWSKSKQCYVVVSEMAKNTTGKKKIVVAGILASLMMQPLATMDVDASASFGYSNKKGSISINGHSTSNATASEENAIAIGQNSNASGRGGISLGNDTSAAWNAFAGGWNAKATGKGAVALGQATANSESAIALGTDTSATANSATAIGNGANASKSDAIAVGTSAAASESNSIALGKNTQAKTSQAIAVGEGATADGTATIAIGAGNSATGWGATAIGKNVQVTKERSTGLGWDLTVDQSAATLVGYNSQVHANQGTGLGSTINITSAAQYGTGIGYQVDVSGKNAVAIGSSGDTGTHTTASATDAVSIGTATVASGEAATAIGKQAAASGSDAVSIGTSSKATGSDSLALGKNANASNSDSIAIGQDSVADSINGVALGKTSKATGSSATALGPQSTASGTYSTAIGMNSVANKEYAIAIGGSSQATVERGVALGTYSIADTASGVSGYDANTNRTNKYAGLTGKALTSTWGAVSIGDSTNTRQITGLAAGTKDTDAVNVAQLKSVNLAFTGDNSSSGDVNLANSKLAITGDTTYITTTAASQGIAIKGVKKDITVSNGTASASAGMADAKNVAEAINQANADQKITYKANSGTTNSVKLSDGLNFTNGTSTVATVGNNGQVTYDLNAATKKSIADSETAVKRTISLGADSGTRSSQSLNDNNVDFNVKGSSGSYINTSMAGNTVTINTTKGTIQSDASGTASLSGADGLATAQNVATAINQAKEGSAWNLAVNSGAAQKVSGGNKVTFKDGKNISLTQTGTTITVGTTDQLTADNVTVGTGANQIVLNGTTGEVSGKSIKAGNTIMNTSGLTISGGPSVTSTGINAGNKVISGVSQAVAGTDAVNKNQMDAAVKAVADSTSELGKNTITLATQSGSTTGQTLNSATGIKFYINGESGSDALISTSASGTNVSVAATQKLKDAVTQAANAANKDLSNLSTAGDTHIKGLAKTAATWNVSTNGSNNTAVAGGETVNFINGDNIAITNTGRNITIGTAKNVSFDKVTVGGVTIDKTDGINAGGKAISNVGTGRVSNSSTDDGNVANIGDVKAIANDAVSNLSTSLGVTDGTNSGTVNLKNQSLKVVGTGVAKATVNGQTITVDVAKGTLTNNTTTGALIGTAGVVDANDMVTAVNTAITKAVDTATGTQKLDVSAGGTDSSVNLKTQKLTVAGTGAATASLNNQTITVDVAQGTFTNKSDGTTSATAGVAKATDVAAAINNANTVLSQKITDATGTLGNNTFTLKADSTDTTAQALNKSGGLAFKVAGDGDLVSTSATTDTVNVTV
ncbi:MAG: ESPR-type extended signal peptide-containing protein, partial [Veillonella sp.]|uniref:ESPR-type extended signal peptide-containing protein n=1 Tax=Veillonella sp. TaxID=1926307 RepID=UPI00290B11D9